MSHEQSETVQDERTKKWINVYGRNTPNAGKRLPGDGEYDTVDQATSAARKRSTGMVRLDSIEEEKKPVRLSDVPDAAAASSPVAANLAAIDSQREAESFEEPKTFAYLFNRIKKGAAGFLGMPGDYVQAVRTSPGAPTTPAAFSTLDRSGRLPEVTTGAQERAAELDRTVKPVMATSGQYREAFGYDQNMKTGSDLLRYTGGVAEMTAAGGPFALASKPAQVLPILTSSFGSGLGMEAGGDVASGLGIPREVGEAGGAVLGGVATAVVPNAGTAAYSAMKNRLSPSANKARAESQVGREVAEQLESYPPAAQNVQRSLEISDEITGFSPSLPARSGAPGLLAEEKRLVTQNPKTLNRAVQTAEENERAIRTYVDAKFPKVGGETAAQRVDRLRAASAARLEGIRTQIDEKLDDALRVFEANPSNFENGQRLRDLLFKQKEVYAGIRSQKYQQVYEAAERLGVKADIDDAAQYAKGVLESEFTAYQASEIPPVFRQLAKEQGDISFAKLHSLYKRANADLASLRGSSSVDKDFKIHLLENLKSTLTEKIKGFEADGFGEVAVKLKEANRFYAEEYVPRFKQGFGADVAARYPSGEFRTPDQLVTELITRKGNNTQAAKDFKLLFDEVPEAMQSLRNGYLDDLYRNGGIVSKEGRLNQKALDTFLRKHEPTLKEFPEIRKELHGLALDNAALLERRAYIVQAEKQLAAHDLYRLFQGKDPAVVLTEATSNPNVMRTLAFTARNDVNMQKGLARGIAEHVTTQPDPLAFFTANEEAIRIGLRQLGDEHFRNLKTVAEAMAINRRNPAPQSVNAASVVPDSIAESLGSSPRAIIAHFLNVQRGRTGASQEGAAFLGRWFDKLRRDHKAVAMEAVFYDKDAARALANLARNPASEKAQIDFATQMMSLGVRAEVAGQE